MKIMKRLLLIHWHYFAHQMIEFEKINFLTGQNATGKSTIIDAMQLLLLCDTSGSFFNKAANGKGDRTLNGYLRGELGDDEDSGFRYLRGGRFTSYIALEFYDDIKKRYFTSGCCFDTFGENDQQKLFFRFDGKMPDSEFTRGNEKGNRIPLSIEELRGFIRAGYSDSQSYSTTVNKDFREDLCGKLGGIQPKRFTDLLKKAVSFNPNVNIQEFITDFVCGEQQEVVISDLLENIRSYDILKNESEILKERISLLADIKKSYAEYLKLKDSEFLYNYLIDRAELDINSVELQQVVKNAEELKSSHAQLEQKLESAKKEQDQLQAERDSLMLQLDGNENSRRLEELEKQIVEKTEECSRITNTFELCTARLHGSVSAWRSSIDAINESINETNLSLIDPLFHERISEVRSNGAELLANAEAVKLSSEYDSATVTSLFRHAENYRDRCKSLRERLGEARMDAAKESNALHKEKAMLEKGKYQFPQDALDLRDAIQSRLRSKFGEDAKAVIVAEASEIADDRWRNVIEGYLGSQKFYVIVAPEHFHMAFRLFDAIKRQKAIYNTGLVDTEKLNRLSPKRDEGSLAEELTTDNPAVRLFIDFTLGRVHKCDNTTELRRYKTAITDDGVLYQSFAVRAMNPKRWETPAIGQAGARLRLETITLELKRLSQVIASYASLSAALNGAEQMPRLGETDAERLVSAANEMNILPSIKETILRLEADARTIDRSEIEALRERLGQRESALQTLKDEISALTERKGGVQTLLGTATDVTIPALEAELSQKKSNYESVYPDTYIIEIGNPRYERECHARGAAGIIAAFQRMKTGSYNSKNTVWQSIRDLRSQYNNTYKMGHDTSAEDNTVYEQAWNEYSNNKLPEYEAKIEDTRDKAYQQFKEDFLSRLQSNILNARNQIDELNAAMKGASFGEDSYRFKVGANPEEKRYYDMIMDRMTLEGGYNLFSEQFNTKYADEMDELFGIITNDSSSQRAASAEDHEKRVKKYTDYKSYLSFDLEVMKPNGDSERLSKTMGKKSGGETQTPFYIAVLASFVQLYRVGRDKTANTIRLIIFDEAFSKMDGERIIQSIEPLKRYNFQVLLSAPPDKVHDIATLVDRNLCTVRDGRKTRVLTFDSRQLEEFADEQEL